ncbi:enoyl-CoA hydratase/isomerase family protein [Aurantimonas endophytica]|uniref:Enoyl-CoA hydratase/carnithine racemase n=1 Tax=Aurantimonas endophytica TaxID=1522175 RepID=A0A7W6HBR9_9HYPH|nr:enoyl-CoA hydratase/isomerase family protein [Aurantimonas endophytica]MBB4002197.1 enoyl-CoA hydratase/carnithine racemase [Aurantimonas endophytica]MCO6402174.1 enoyl-CoA hydratase [Aurantimonas endophytica]
MSQDELLYEVRGRTGWITLNRPQARNALTFAMYEGLAEICRTVPTDGSVKCLVVTGAGEKAFAAGTDMAQFRGFSADQDALDYEHKMDVVLGAVEACKLPIIAAISGACTGGGAAIAAACDIRIATTDLRFGFPIARTLGNCLSITNLSRLSSLMGPGRTKEIIFTARLLGAEEALSCGLVSEIIADHAALIARAEELASLLAGHAPITLATTKEALRRLRVEGAGADDRDLVVKAYMSVDFKEGIEAFLGKRKPEWKGR